MKIAIECAGFSPAEADQLRRAVTGFRRYGDIETFEQKFIHGMLDRDYERAFAERCFAQLRGFASYGFPESHAASFALLVYVSAWIKKHYPAVFAVTLLNSQPMGFYAPAQIVRDAQEHGVTVLPVDVNASDWDCTLQSRDVVRLGFRQIKGMRDADAQTLVNLRQRRGAFESVDAVQQAAGFAQPIMQRLAEADAFGSVGSSRRLALWKSARAVDDRAWPSTIGAAGKLRTADAVGSLGAVNATGEVGALDGPPSTAYPIDAEPAVQLPVMSEMAEVKSDYATTGLSLKQHPVGLVRDELRRRQYIENRTLVTLPQGRWVKVAGLVLIRQRPGTAAGIVFETIEDETGVANLIISPKVFDRDRPAARHASFAGAEGRVERQGTVVHVHVWRMVDLTELLNCEQPSRDFK